MPATLAPDPRESSNCASSPSLLPPPKHSRQTSSSSSSSSRSDHSFGEEAERRVRMNRPRTGGIDFGQPLPSDVAAAPPPPPKQQSGIPRSAGSSGSAQRKSSSQSWTDQTQSAGSGSRKPSWGTGATGAGMWGTSITGTGGAGEGTATGSATRNASVSGRQGAGMSRTARPGLVASVGSSGIPARASTSQASAAHRVSSTSTPSQHRDQPSSSYSGRQQSERPMSAISKAPSFHGNRMSTYSMSSSFDHPYASASLAGPSLHDPSQSSNRFSRSSYTPGSGSKRFSAASAGSLNTPYAVYQPQVSVRQEALPEAGPAAGDSWEGGDSEGEPKTSPSRTSEEETASLASFTSTSEDDLLKQEALRRPSWVSIRLPSFASASTSRSNSTAGTITNGLSPKIGSSRSPPTSPRIEYEGSDASDFQQSMREVIHPPPNVRAQSSPTLPMGASFSRASAKKLSPITISAPFTSNAIVSPREPPPAPPVPPKVQQLSTQRTLTDIAEMTRSTSSSSVTSTLPALPARSPLRARRGAPGSPTPSQTSTASTNAQDSDVSSADGDRASPGHGAGEFGEADRSADLTTVRPRRASRHRPKTADETLGSARWSTVDAPPRAASQFHEADEGAVWLDDDGEEKRRMSRTRPTSTASRSGLVAGSRSTDPQMRKKREARVISTEDAAASEIGLAGMSYQGLGRSSNGSASGPVETTRSPSLPLHAATSVVPDIHVPKITTASSAFPSQRSPPTSGPPKSPSASLTSHHPTHQRSNSQPMPMLSAQPGAASPAPPTSKRAHLLHEISSTERSYAFDLGLVRDAYLFRIRPASQTESNATTDGNTTQPTTVGSNRSSMATYDTARTSTEGTDDGRADRKSKISTGSNERMSFGNDSTGQSTVSLPGTSIDIPLAKSSAQSIAPSLGGVSASPSSYFPPPSPRPLTMRSAHSFGSGNGSSTPSTAPCPLSPADVRAVFLNLETIAALAHEFASLLEGASSPAAEDGGKDMIGEIFLTMMPRLRQAYTSYCPRQAGAHARFLELLVDRRYAGYFAECWTAIQPHTNSWDLPSMLIKPVQRVLKYPLLLDDLLRQTPASHPDHANLKKASTAVRSLADEINEIKRRKDTVESIMHKGRDIHAGGANLSKEKSRRGGVMTSFRKDRAKGSSSSASAATAAAMSFTASSHEDLRKTETAYAALVSRLMTAETTAKRLGKAVASTGPKARDSWVAQRRALDSWRRIINLGGVEPVEDIRIEAFRAIVDQVIQGPCVAMERELQSEIVPAFIKLFAVCKGPRTVILKRNANHEDYNRVIITKARGGDIERLPQEVLEGAQVFVALHHQLLAELPPLLEGFATILDIVLKALAACHARFHRRVQDLLAGFWNEFPPVVMDVESETAHISSDGPAIIRVWEEASRIPTEMVEDLAITRKISVRLLDAPVRLASGSLNQIHEGIVDQRSNGGYATTTPRSSGASSRPSPGLTRKSSKSRHSATTTTTTTTTTTSSPAVPSRSLSKLDLPIGDPRLQHRPTSPNPPLERKSSARAIPTPRRMPSAAAADDMDRASASSVASIGPALSQMSFEGSDASNHERFAESVIRRLSYAQDGPAASINRLSSFEQDAIPPAVRGAGAARADPRSPAQDRSFGGGGGGIETTPTKSPASVLPLIDPSSSSSTTAADDDDDDEGNDVEWDALGADAEVLYRCECVADFDLQGLELQYMGHRFLRIARGDLVEILFEVGRVDELDDFPLDVGLEDDGLLIGKDGAGTQGFVLCSFLHPIFDEDEA